MTKNNALSDIELLMNGRRSGIRRLTWRETKSQLERMTRRAPETVVKVTGSTKNSAHALESMKYITRDKEDTQIPLENERGEIIDSKEGVRSIHDSWDIENQRGHGKLAMTFNVVLSMPEGTNAKKLLAAARAFAKDAFPNRQYVMALHTPETDPKPGAPKQPHVHIIVKAEDRYGERLYIRKPLLQQWREQFAVQLRAQGIDALATARDVRGNSLKHKKDGEYRATRRGESTALAKRFREAADPDQWNKPRPWEAAMARRRAAVVAAGLDAAERLRAEGETQLAQQVAEHVQHLPPLTTERHGMMRAIQGETQARRNGKTIAEHEQPARSK